MIDSLEATPGDCCYFLVRNEKKIKFGTIVSTIPSESAVLVMESLDSKFFTIWEKNAAWEEKDLKQRKWQQPHNYKRIIAPGDLNENKKSNDRVCTVRGGTKRKSKSRRVKRKG